MTAALPMGGNKITGMADPTLSSDGATKNYVDTTTAAFFSTGDVKFTIKTAADSGWVLFDDGTIGSATSGASSRASADTQSLFTLIFNNIADADAPIFTSGGGATTRAGQTNAATAWAANCRISLTKTLGRALGVAGTGSGLTARALGHTVGAETAVLTTPNLPPYTPAGAITNGAITTTGTVNGSPAQGGSTVGSSGGSGVSTPINANALLLNSTQAASSFAGTAQGGTSAPVPIMPPMSYLNAMIKL